MRALLIAGFVIGLPLAARADSGLGRFMDPQAQTEAGKFLRDRIESGTTILRDIQPGYTFDLDKSRSGGTRYYEVEPPGVEPPRTGVPGIAGTGPTMEAFVDTMPYAIEPAGTEGDGKAQIFLSEEECGTVALQSSGIDGGSRFGTLLARMVAACRSAFDASS